MSNNNPWGTPPGSEDKGEGEGEPPKPRNPWQPGIIPGGKSRGPSIEEIFRKGKGGGGGFGGGFSGLPKRPDGKSWVPLVVGVLVLTWLFLSSVHRLGPGEEGVVTRLGSYSRTVGPGINFTLPAPLEQMEKVNALEIRTLQVGSAQQTEENLVLTSDQSVIDMAYEVRWNISDPKLYLFQLDDPEGAISGAAESAMRAAVANYKLTDAIGPQRAAIEGDVQTRMQNILNSYRSGVAIQGIAIRQSDPPQEVNEAFRKVNAAQQKRESYLNDARAYASQVLERARGDTAAFDKIYEQYKLAPQVTRRRLYYETMESVLGNIDKTIVESGGVQTYLPLPEIKKRSVTPSAGTTVEGAK